MDSTLGGSAGRIGRTGSGGGSRSGSASGGRDNPYALGGGGASTAAWTRLVSSGVEDELLGMAGAGGGRAGGLFPPPPPPPQGHFLDACFLCRKPLASNRDIFMYRGDLPFCSEDCRREQIEMDEEMERKETTSKKVAQRASSPQDVESPPRPPKARAGSILAG